MGVCQEPGARVKQSRVREVLSGGSNNLAKAFPEVTSIVEAQATNDFHCSYTSAGLHQPARCLRFDGNRAARRHAGVRIERKI